MTPSPKKLKKSLIQKRKPNQQSTAFSDPFAGTYVEPPEPEEPDETEELVDIGISEVNQEDTGKSSDVP